MEQNLCLRTIRFFSAYLYFIAGRAVCYSCDLFYIYKRDIKNIEISDALGVSCFYLLPENCFFNII